MHRGYFRLLSRIIVRLANAAFTVVLLSFLVFTAVNLLPSDAAEALLSQEQNPELLERMREAMGLNTPLLERYGKWVLGVLHGDFGRSLAMGAGGMGQEMLGEPVNAELFEKLLNTLLLVVAVMLIVVPATLLAGVWSAVRAGSAVEGGVQFLMLGIYAMPDFVVGAVLIVTFCFWWVLLPAVSYEISFLTMILPVATLALGSIAYSARLVRAGILEVMKMDHVTVARFKGISERQIMRRHVMPLAIIPALETFAQTLAYLAGGAVVVETLFGYPGLGSGLIEAINARDTPVITAYVVIISSAYVIANLIVELVQLWLNPRLREA